MISWSYADRTEIKLFFAFLLVFTMFIHWGGDNSWSRYDLTASVVEDQSLDISNYSHNTLDKAILRSESLEKSIDRAEKDQDIDQMERGLIDILETPGLQIYTGKAPMSSFLAIPAYIAGDKVGVFLDQQSKDVWVNRSISDKAVELSSETVLQQFLIVFTTSVFLGALLFVFIYRYLQDYVTKKTALYTTFIAGISTPLFYYATTYFGVITAAFFGFISYFLLQKGLEKDSRGRIYLAGILSALAFSTEYHAVLIPAGLTVYLLSQRKSINVARFIGGMIIGAIPLFLYHWAITGNPLIPVMASSLQPGPINAVCSMYGPCVAAGRPTLLGFQLEPIRILNTAFRLLFMETRGLFFYSPILLLAIPGTYELYKREKKLLIVSPGIFVGFFFFQAMRLNWLAGVSFGPRYAIVGIPFLILPIALGLKKMLDKGKICQIFILLVFLISAFNMFLGFNTLKSLDIRNDTYSDRFNSLSAVQPDFYDHQIKEFKKYGARSEVLMSLTGRHKGLDITYRSPYGQEYIGLGTLNGKELLFATKMLPIVAAIFILLVLWPYPGKLRLLGIAAIFLLILGSFSLSSAYISGEGFDQGDSVGAVNNSLDLIFYADEGDLLRLETRMHSPENITSDLSAVFNENNTRKYKVADSQDIYYRVEKDGKNRVSLKTPECWIPAVYRDSSDIRCLSVFVENISVIAEEDVNKSSMLFDRGWYAEEVKDQRSWRWMSNKSLLLFYSDGAEILELSASSYKDINNSDLKIFVNGRNVDNVSFKDSESQRIPITPEKGLTNLEFESSKGCKRPAEFLENSNDNRCLSYRFENLSFNDSSKLESGWYDTETSSGSSFRWMDERASISFLTEKEKISIYLKMTPYGKLPDPTLEVNINGNSVRTLKPGDSGLIEENITFETIDGFNSVSFYSETGCEVPAMKEDSKDNRCLSFRRDSFEITEIESEEPNFPMKKLNEQSKPLQNKFKIAP